MGKKASFLSLPQMARQKVEHGNRLVAPTIQEAAGGGDCFLLLQKTTGELAENGPLAVEQALFSLMKESVFYSHLSGVLD